MSSDSSTQVSATTGFDQSILRLWTRWNEFWFTPADPISLGVLRLLTGAMLIYSTIVWGIDLPAFFGVDGWHSKELMEALQRNDRVYSFWWDVPLEAMVTVHWWCLGILVLYWIGFCTRLTSIAAYVIHVSYCQRAAVATYGLDQILGILLLYLAIGPSGATFSVDNLLRRGWRWLRTPPAERSTAMNPIRYSVSANLALRLIQVHYCVIYFFAAGGKMLGDPWWTGDALWLAIANYEYQSFDLTWLAWFPELIQLMTHIIMLWELSFAYLVWVRPMRPVMLTMGILMHLGIGAFLGMWTFGSMMIVGYLAFIQPETVRWALALPFRLRKTPTAATA